MIFSILEAKEHINNPWEVNNDAQKQWTAKWKYEQVTCKACQKQFRCNVLDRMDINICQLLKERSR
jgi:hypothetical protein